VTYTGPKLTRISTVPAARGVRLCSYPRPPVLVIEVGGDIDARNAGGVNRYLLGFVHVGRPLVLDFGGVDFVDIAGFRAVLRFAAECRQARRDWFMVASDAVKLLLRAAPGYRLPVVESLAEALQRLAETPNAEWRLRSITTVESKRLAGG